jgi:xanthosine phosphorylase
MTELARFAVKVIHDRLPHVAPRFGIVLGSGLGALAEEMQDRVVFPYSDLPGFPTRVIEGQQAQLTVGRIHQIPVVCLQGRAHFYEGCESSEILTYIRALKLLGCESVIITGAVGSLRAEIQPGQLILLKDHINFQGRNPLAGVNDSEFGPRFPEMLDAYDRNWRQHLEKVGYDLSMPLMEGVYISVLGPSFETPAEIRCFREWGADVVGMSVVPDVIAARHCGLRVVGLTVVTNLAAGLSTIPPSHEETLRTAEKAAYQMISLIRSFMSTLENN